MIKGKKMTKAYENKKTYNANWTSDHTKNVTIRFNRDDDVWSMIAELKANGIKMNALFKEAVIREVEKLKQ